MRPFNTRRVSVNLPAVRLEGGVVCPRIDGIHHLHAELRRFALVVLVVAGGHGALPCRVVSVPSVALRADDGVRF